MLYLMLAICSSALISVIMRLGSAGESSRRPLLAVNYLTCALISLIFLPRGSQWGGGGMGVALGLGLLGGALYLGAFVLMQENVRRSGVTLSSAFMKLGVIVPTVLGITLFGERLGLARGLGIALTLAAIAALSGGGEKGRGGALLALLTLVGGLADGLSKFYEAYGTPALEGLFLCLVFASALLMCAGLCALRGERPRRRDWLFGALLGVPNYFSSRFLLLALSSVPASAAYPVFSCGTILLTTAAGTLLFRERPDRRQLIALGFVLAALALLNLPA